MNIVDLMKTEGYSEKDFSVFKKVFFSISEETISLIKKHSPISSIKKSVDKDAQKACPFTTGGDIDIDY